MKDDHLFPEFAPIPCTAAWHLEEGEKHVQLLFIYLAAESLATSFLAYVVKRIGAEPVKKMVTFWIQHLYGQQWDAMI